MTDLNSHTISSSFSDNSMILNSLSIGISVNKKIQDQGDLGWIHSIFERVINICIRGNSLISIVGKEIGNGPLNILVDVPPNINLLTAGIKIGDLVTRSGDLITLGDNSLIISNKRAELWIPKRKYFVNLQPINSIVTNLEFLRNLTVRDHPLIGINELISFTNLDGIDQGPIHKLGTLSIFALPHISSLLKAIKEGNLTNIDHISSKLVGLGSGLTPAADDILLGLMISMIYFSENFPESSIDVKKINHTITSNVSGRTTFISQEFLRETSIGNVSEFVAILLEKLLTSDQQEVENSARKVLNLGGTSGVDIVFGIILGGFLIISDVINQKNHVQ